MFSQYWEKLREEGGWGKNLKVLSFGYKDDDDSQKLYFEKKAMPWFVIFGSQISEAAC